MVQLHYRRFAPPPSPATKQRGRPPKRDCRGKTATFAQRSFAPAAERDRAARELDGTHARTPGRRALVSRCAGSISGHPSPSGSPMKPDRRVDHSITFHVSMGASTALSVLPRIGPVVAVIEAVDHTAATVVVWGRRSAGVGERGMYARLGRIFMARLPVLLLGMLGSSLSRLAYRRSRYGAMREIPAPSAGSRVRSRPRQPALMLDPADAAIRAQSRPDRMSTARMRDDARNLEQICFQFDCSLQKASLERDGYIGVSSIISMLYMAFGVKENSFSLQVSTKSDQLQTHPDPAYRSCGSLKPCAISHRDYSASATDFPANRDESNVDGIDWTTAPDDPAADREDSANRRLIPTRDSGERTG